MTTQIARATAVTSAAILLALAVPAAASAPKAGTYQGCPNSATTTNGHCEGEGYFSLQGNKIKGYNGSILVPSDFACNQLNASLETRSIKVTGGAFDYAGTAKIGYGSSPSGPFKKMDIRFKGSWKSASKVTGFTRISGRNSRGKCDSGKVAWKMKTPPPA